DGIGDALDPDARPAAAASVVAPDRLERVDPVGARILAEPQEDHALSVRHRRIIAYRRQSLVRGIGVRSTYADASLRESLDGSVTPLRHSLPRGSRRRGLAGRHGGKPTRRYVNDLRSVARTRADILEARGGPDDGRVRRRPGSDHDRCR